MAVRIDYLLRVAPSEDYPPKSRTVENHVGTGEPGAPDHSANTS